MSDSSSGDALKAGRDTIKQTAIPCDCGSCGVVLITEFEPWGEDPEQVYVQFFQSFHGGNLRARLRAARRIIRGRDPWLHDVVLQGESLRLMREVWSR